MQSMREEEKVFDFLMGLDDTYSTLKSYAIAAQEEKQRSVAANRTPTIEATTLLTKGVESRQRKNEDGARHQFPPCIHCGRTNHSKNYCFKVIGYPSDWRKPGKKNSKQTNNDQMQSRAHQKYQRESNQLPGVALAAPTEGPMSPIPGLTYAQHQQLLALLGNQGASTGNPSVNMAASNFSGKTKEEWIVDTGATNHIARDINSLSNKIVRPDLPPTQILNGDMMKVHHALGQVALGK
ncbi:hypothetical protein A4A49_54276 [Nicotiana attenuata]|uniref:Uncharacterized protein n=1 Tax=Nicotiana attenuata TaxID=49451 RepID=A0A1J6KBC2_NICAT|nr:hypothetical protein A4A49_54276 [Nicotiana attenuata]